MLNEKNELILGDALEELKKIENNYIDLGITSPPYNKQEKNNGGLVNSVIYNEFKDKKSEKKYREEQINVLNEIYRITKEGGSFFYNHKVRWERGELYHPLDWLRDTKWCLKQEIIWDRTIAGNIRGWRFWQVEERIYWLYKPIGNNKIGEELLSKDAKMTSIWRNVPENNNPHPAPYPLWLPSRIIISILGNKGGGIVLDPYVGSGTTCVASKLLGFDYIGIDISEIYINYATNRLKKFKQETDKIEKEISLHRVEKTFKQRKLNGEYKPKQRKIMINEINVNKEKLF